MAGPTVRNTAGSQPAFEAERCHMTGHQHNLVDYSFMSGSTATREAWASGTAGLPQRGPAQKADSIERQMSLWGRQRGGLFLAAAPATAASVEN